MGWQICLQSPQNNRLSKGHCLSETRCHSPRLCWWPPKAGLQTQVWLPTGHIYLDVTHRYLKLIMLKNCTYFSPQSCFSSCILSVTDSTKLKTWKSPLIPPPAPSSPLFSQSLTFIYNNKDCYQITIWNEFERIQIIIQIQIWNYSFHMLSNNKDFK